MNDKIYECPRCNYIDLKENMKPISKAKDEYYKRVKPMLHDTDSSGHIAYDYIMELEQRISHLIDSNVARDLVIKANEQQKAELIDLLNTIKNDCLEPYKHSYYINKINKHKGD